jgi:hypothetical protein
MINTISFADTTRKGDAMIAKDLMPWLFVSRKSGWTPFAKVRREDEPRGAAPARRRARLVRRSRRVH